MSTAPAVVDPYDITVRSNGLRRRASSRRCSALLAFLAPCSPARSWSSSSDPRVYKGAAS